MINKKAASHVEIVFAFIIFVGFVLFLLYYIKPFQSDVLEDSVLLSVRDNFFEAASTNLTIVLVNSTSYCEPKSIPGVDYSRMGSKKIDTTPPKVGYFYVYFSEEFTGHFANDCSDTSIKLGNIDSSIVLSNSSLATIKQNYLSDYDSLKNYLSLPPNIDFSILSIGGYTLEKKSPGQVKVVAGAYRKQVLNSEGTLENRDFIVKVW